MYAVVEMTAIQFQTVTLDVQNQSRQVERAILTLAVDPSAGGNAAAYLQLSSTPGDLPANLTSVAFASVVEEHQFFIREDFAIPGDATSPPTPKLARARMLPGTDALHPDGAIDVADNVFDLQVALGVDLDGNGRVDVEDAGGQALATNADEWLWNDATDDTSLAWDTASLQHVRLTIVGQAQTADRRYVAPALADVENRDYNESSAPSGARGGGATVSPPRSPEHRRPEEPVMTSDSITRSREQGSAYLIALMALSLLTILGVSVSLVTQTEILSSSQERIIERTFYAAESGLEASTARALGEGDFGPVEHVASRTELEQGSLMKVQERVQSSPFFCMGDAPCNLCSINQGAQYVRRNHMVAVNATRSAVGGDGTEALLGRKSLSAHFDVEPTQTVLDCLAELPSESAVFRFDTFERRPASFPASISSSSG